MTQTPLRIGVLRPDRPFAPLADAEARVIEQELGRRLGPVVLDLRVDGTALGRWQPAEHAGWPATVDARVPSGRLWADDVPPLTALLGTTVEPRAADVRRRMLAHLGLTADVLDDAALAALQALRPSPTDCWLIAATATAITVADPRWHALAAPTHDQLAQIAAAFDAVAASLADDPVVATAQSAELARRTAECATLAEEITRMHTEHIRAQAQAADRIADLTAALRSAEDRLERTELSG